MFFSHPKAFSHSSAYGIIRLLNFRDIEERVDAKKDISAKNQAPG